MNLWTSIKAHRRQDDKNKSIGLTCLYSIMVEILSVRIAT